MQSVKINTKATRSFIPDAELENWTNRSLQALSLLHSGKGKGADFWDGLTFPLGHSRSSGAD
jgi:hypothetical protein